jgi:hypothetical protein
MVLPALTINDFECGKLFCSRRFIFMNENKLVIAVVVIILGITAIIIQRLKTIRIEFDKRSTHGADNGDPERKV